MVNAFEMSLITPDLLRSGHGLYVKGIEIEGLRTPYVVFRENRLDEVNRIVVKLEYVAPQGVNLSMKKNCFVVAGRMTIQDLGELVTVELQSTKAQPVAFTVEGHVLAEDCLFSKVNKLFMCKDGFVSLVCMTEIIEEEDTAE